MENTYTIVPAPTLEKLEPFLQENNIEYSLLYGKDIPKDVPESCMWHGHEVHRHIVCVVSTLDPEKLLHADEDLHYGIIPNL